ncbi:bifunctional phosphatase IMPL2, chloroplastic [Solanum lycopersicum]|uniref:bifunctional phosphatase IMPL2, chloroplastic n=1 Tax=Solanum lycopersicum TaxID=4081 RepID=UPI0002768BB2|nr:bifunctional phosphatase IMPL2, chloroplastic [Solanum lycopersicum]
MQMLSQSHFLSLYPRNSSPLSSSFSAFSGGCNTRKIVSGSLAFQHSGIHSFPISHGIKLASPVMTSNCVLPSNQAQIVDFGVEDSELGKFAAVGNKIADAAGEVIRKYFRKSFDILDKEDLSPVTIADQAAEESMVKIIQENFPSHAIYGEEKGWRCQEETAEYVWVLDPIDGTKSFITGKPVFGTLIALLYKGKPILGVIDQPVLRERWIGLSGRRTTLNGQEISTRNCSSLSKAYMYTTSPHLFEGDAEIAFARVRSKVKVPLYGCDCYAYALLASGFVDLVVESGLKPYDFLSLVPVIEGAGGTITDWKGQHFNWKASAGSPATSFNVVAAGDKEVHQEALDALQWR